MDVASDDVEKIVTTLISRGKKPFTGAELEIVSWGSGYCDFKARVITELLKLGYKIKTFRAVEPSWMDIPGNYQCDFKKNSIRVTPGEAIEKLESLLNLSRNCSKKLEDGVWDLASKEDQANLRMGFTFGERKFINPEISRTLKKVDLFLSSNPKVDHKKGTNALDMKYIFRDMNNDTTLPNPHFFTSLNDKCNKLHGFYHGDEGLKQFERYAYGYLSY